MALDKPRLEIFTGFDDQYYWRLKAINGRVIAIGGEGYSSEANAREAVFTTIGILSSGWFDLRDISDKDIQEDATP